MGRATGGGVAIKDRPKAGAWMSALWAALFVGLSHASLAQPCGCTSDVPFWSPLVVEAAQSYGAYTIRVWRSFDANASAFHGAVTIEREGEILLLVDGAMGLGVPTGIDIDGSGWPNVVVETYSGGAHCCFATRIFDLAETLVEIPLPPPPGGNAPAELADLDGDGIFEVLTADDSFAYVYCAYAGSPAVRVVLAYDPMERRYVPASPRFPWLYAGVIVHDEERAKACQSAGADRGWDGTSKCEVLPLVLDYLYLGDPEAAWRALATYYAASDLDAFRAEIEAVVVASPYYAPRP